MTIKKYMAKEPFAFLDQLNENLARLHYRERKPCIVEAYLLSNYKEYEYKKLDVHQMRCTKYKSCNECILHWLHYEEA